MEIRIICWFVAILTGNCEKWLFYGFHEISIISTLEWVFHFGLQEYFCNWWNFVEACSMIDDIFCFLEKLKFQKRAWVHSVPVIQSQIGALGQIKIQNLFISVCGRAVDKSVFQNRAVLGGGEREWTTRNVIRVGKIRQEAESPFASD